MAGVLQQLDALGVKPSKAAPVTGGVLNELDHMVGKDLSPAAAPKNPAAEMPVAAPSHESIFQHIGNVVNKAGSDLLHKILPGPAAPKGPVGTPTLDRLDSMSGKKAPVAAQEPQGKAQPVAPVDGAPALDTGVFKGKMQSSTVPITDEQKNTPTQPFDYNNIPFVPFGKALLKSAGRATGLINDGPLIVSGGPHDTTQDPLKPLKAFESQNLKDATKEVNLLSGEPVKELPGGFILIGDKLYTKEQARALPRGSALLQSLIAGFSGHGEGAAGFGEAKGAARVSAEEAALRPKSNNLAVDSFTPENLQRAFEQNGGTKVGHTVSDAEGNILRVEKITKGAADGTITVEAKPAGDKSAAPHEITIETKNLQLPPTLDEGVSSITSKSAKAQSAEEFYKSLTADEQALVVRAAGTEAHVDESIAVPKTKMEEIPNTPDLYRAPGSDNIYFKDARGRFNFVDAEAAAKEYFQTTGGEVAEPIATDAQMSEQTKINAQARSSVVNEIQDLKSQIEIYQEHLDLNPGKKLIKYYGGQDPRGANLDDIFSRAVGKGKKSSGLDSIVTEVGDFESVQAAHEGVLGYLDSKDTLVALRNRLKSLQETLKTMPEELPSGPAARANRPLFVKPARMSKADQRMFSVGDLIRRRAIIANRPKLIKGAVEGEASDSAQYAALVDSHQGEITRGPFKGWTHDTKDWFRRWVFGRQAAPYETKLTMRGFSSVEKAWKKGGMELVYKYEGVEPKGQVLVGIGKDHTGLVADVEDLFARFLEEEQAAGVPVRQRQGYLPLYLADKGDLGPAVEGRNVGLRPGFTMSRIYESYAEAISAGEKPLYDNLYDIVQARARAHFKAMADAKFFNEGVQAGRIIPKSAVLDDLRGEFRDLDSERFPARKAMYGNNIYNGVYTAAGPVAGKINNYLRDPIKWLKTVADLASSAKGSVMSVGIPGTAINPHLWNLLPREVLSDLAISPASAPREISKFLYYSINPSAARRYIEANFEKAMPLLRNGMTFTSEGFSMRELGQSEGLMGKLGARGKQVSHFLHNVFGGNMFGGLIPARKMYNGLRIMDAYKKAGYSAEESAQMAADAMNTMYGGINTEAMARDKNFQMILRGLIFAPDYAETNLRLGQKTGSALIGRGDRIKFKQNSKGVFSEPKAFNFYKRFSYWLAGLYVVANIVNYENSGKLMVQNDPIHTFDIAWGKDSKGKTRYVKVFGTGVDFLRWPFQFALSIAEGKGNEALASINDRLSTVARPVLSLLTNSDWRGDPIFGPDNYGKAQTGQQQAINFFNITIGAQLPGSISTGVGYFKGTQSGEQTIVQAGGLPFSFKNERPTTGEINTLRAQAAADIKNGDYSLFNKLVKAGVITPRTRGTFIRAALQGPTKRQTESAAKRKARLDAEKQKLQDMGF